MYTAERMKIMKFSLIPTKLQKFETFRAKYVNTCMYIDHDF